MDSELEDCIDLFSVDMT